MQNYIKIHLSGAVVIANSTMKAFEELLPPAQFIRIHRSYIVNVHVITAVRSNQVDLKNISLPIGTNHKDQLLKAIGQV